MGAPAGVNADFRALLTDPNATFTFGGGTISHVESIDYLEGSAFDDTLAPASTSYSYNNLVYGRGGNDHILFGSSPGTA